jgi:Ca2+-binding EF-hand superfamily protein
MIGSVSSYTSYTSTRSASTQNARGQQLQKQLFAKFDSNSDGAVDQDELNRAVPTVRTGDSCQRQVSPQARAYRPIPKN